VKDLYDQTFPFATFWDKNERGTETDADLPEFFDLPKGDRPPHKNAIAKFQRVLCENVAISPPISQVTAAKLPVTPRESSVDDCEGLSMTAEQ
jgi:hypothetical protein